MSRYRTCIWIPDTQTLIYTATDANHPNDPSTFGTFELDEKVLSSLIVRRDSCQDISNIAYLNGNILICCHDSINILNLQDLTITPIISSCDSIHSFRFGTFHPDGTAWFTARDINSDTRIFRLDSKTGNLSQVDFSNFKACGLVRPQCIRWSSDGKTCYLTCSVNMRIYSANYSPQGFMKPRAFSYIPIKSSIIGVVCDPFGNVVAATQHSLFCWDRYGHLLKKFDSEESIVDFTVSDREIILMYQSYWSKLKTELHRRSISDNHLMLARI